MDAADRELDAYRAATRDLSDQMLNLGGCAARWPDPFPRDDLDRP